MKVTLASAWECTHLAARGALVALALTACGQSTDGALQSQGSTAVSDTTDAYLKLSDEVKACADAKDTCVTDAKGDTTKVAACDTEAQACLDKTKDQQAAARKHLGDDAEGCVRECRGHSHHAGDAAVEETDTSKTEADGGAPGTRECFGRHGGAAAFSQQCQDDFFKCLDDTGIRMSSGKDLDDATKAAVEKCVTAAHGCFMNDMMSGGGRRGPGGPGRGGPGHPGHGGAAGEPAHHAAGAGGHHSPGSPHAGSGAGGDDGGRHRGPGGAAGEDPNRHHRPGQGGAGGS